MFGLTDLDMWLLFIHLTGVGFGGGGGGGEWGSRGGGEGGAGSFRVHSDKYNSILLLLWIHRTFDKLDPWTL